MRRILLIVAIIAVVPISLARADSCRLALVLALDVSGSVNEVEYVQQLNGLANAVDSPEVRAAILSGDDAHVHLAVFEWSSQNHQFLILPWTVLDSHAAIDGAAERISTYRKQRAGLKTALSTALMFAAELLQAKSPCWQSTIDVSGDGRNNIGPPIARVYGLDSFAGIAVNALVIGDPASERSTGGSGDLTKSDLRRYYEREVVRGAGAFALIAHGYEDYERAMQMKLLRELAAPVLGSLSRSAVDMSGLPKGIR